MAKHKLSLDSLQVETFDPVADPESGRGTVHANQQTGTGQCATCGQTCNAFNQACTFNQAYTCITCQTNCNCGTQYYSCPGGCEPYTEGYTCVNTCGAYSCICSAFCNSIDVCETETQC